jgi:excisionase family DNA binding protein
MTTIDMLSTADAAGMLGVSQRRVRSLVAQGDLAGVRVGGSLLVDPMSLARRQAVVTGTSRALSPRMSWACLLTDLGTREIRGVAATFGLSAAEAGRLQRSHERAVEDWGWVARRRAVPSLFTVRTGYLHEVTTAPGVVRSGTSALDMFPEVDLTSNTSSAEVYTTSQTVESLRHEFGMRPEADGNIIVRVVADDLWTRLSRHLVVAGVMGSATVAVDLLESVDIRTRRAGADLLATLR